MNAAWTIYCEGYHDRDFLAGLFEESLGFTSLKGDPNPKFRGRGIYGYQRGNVQVQIEPCGGKSKVVPAFANALRNVTTDAPAGLVLCLDEDEATDAASACGRSPTVSRR